MHKPVMTKEVIKYLDIKPNGTYIDFTYGIGGHSNEILKYINKYGNLIVSDYDIKSYNLAKKNKKLKAFNFQFKKLYKIKVLNKNTNGSIIDIGNSLNQIKNKKYGKSYEDKVPLDMRINLKQKLKANDYLNVIKKKDLLNFLLNFLNENISKKIVKNILHLRKKKNIKISNDIQSIIPTNIKKNNKIFNFFRILVNNELFNLNNLINNITNVTKKNSIVIFISFNSSEDEIIKKCLNNNYYIEIKEITKRPNINELNANFSSKSAIIRVFKKFK